MEVPTFDETDTLVQLALHAAMAGGNRLLWCKDLEQAVTNGDPDWDQVIARARAANAGPPVAVMLALASRALCFDIPSGVISELSPGALWMRITCGADRVAPVERWSGGRSVVRDVARATRRNDRASTNALVRRYASMLRTGRLGRPHTTDRDPHSPGSVLFSRRRRCGPRPFFAEVARDARERLMTRSEPHVARVAHHGEERCASSFQCRVFQCFRITDMLRRSSPRVL